MAGRGGALLPPPTQLFWTLSKWTHVSLHKTFRTGILTRTELRDFSYLAMRKCAENIFILQIKYSQKMFEL